MADWPRFPKITPNIGDSSDHLLSVLRVILAYLPPQEASFAAVQLMVEHKMLLIKWNNGLIH